MLTVVQYYKPWELLPDEGDRIEKQIADTEAQINRELAEFEERRKKWLAENARGEAKGANAEIADSNNPSAEQDETTVNENQENPETVGTDPTPSDAAVKPLDNDTVDDATVDGANVDHVSQVEPEQAAKANDDEKDISHDEDGKDAAEDNADHVMDAGEDAVIY